ncbi:carbon-nitrogen hydrolase family protein [Sedimenticola hydrogenitrophicus]|uniref:carbon-nitrogen hydrolase family protein n=1 Tax=Sedimenticola hydrogenitrophicus TaxID=2967975 RepID=UPI0023B1B3E1
MINRRHFNGWLAAALCAGWSGAVRPQATAGTPLRVAALQMTPRLADLQANLAQAEQLIRQARKQGAQWIVLPELFTTAAAFHPDMLAAIQPHDGTPAALLRRLARDTGCTIGGSFLASRQGEVYNSFLLCHPDGQVQQHDKDLPTYWERCFYRGGMDDGVLDTPLGGVGAALCWEMIRSDTLRRLHGRVRLLLCGSCWWTLSDDVEADNPLRAINLEMLRQAPVNCARILGVPVVHASHAGRFNGFFSPDLPDVPYDSSYLGESMIVDAQGRVLARRDATQGAGVVLADIVLPAHAQPLQPLPDTFWLPARMPQPWRSSWERWLTSGARYYESVTRPYLQSVEINEYIPEYML